MPQKSLSLCMRHLNTKYSVLTKSYTLIAACIHPRIQYYRKGLGTMWQLCVQERLNFTLKLFVINKNLHRIGGHVVKSKLYACSFS